MGVNTHPTAKYPVEGNNRKERNLDGCEEVGSDHSRGVTGVMPCEDKKPLEGSDADMYRQGDT